MTKRTNELEKRKALEVVFELAMRNAFERLRFTMSGRKLRRACTAIAKKAVR